MTLYILDTDILTLLEEGHPLVGQRFLQERAEVIAITVLTVEEQMSGWYAQVRKAKRPERLAAEKAKTPVSGFFSNAPLDTVVRLLADMANLTVVRLDNILYVTTPENAKKWDAAPGRLRTRPEPQKKAKVP